jgi:predicted nucleotidyltransferase
MISFRSKIAQKVLSYFLLNPEEGMYMNEMARKFAINRGNLARKLTEWTKEGILLKSKRGNLSLYKINKRYYLLEEMKRIVQKKFGLEKRLADVLKKIEGLKMAFIFGSYAKDKLGPESDVDLLLVGSHNSLKAQEPMTKLQKEFNREINVVDMTESEFQERKGKDEFLKNIFAGEYIQIV